MADIHADGTWLKRHQTCLMSKDRQESDANVTFNSGLKTTSTYLMQATYSLTDFWKICSGAALCKEFF
jgi:hypothetical protein